MLRKIIEYTKTFSLLKKLKKCDTIFLKEILHKNNSCLKKKYISSLLM